MATPTAPLPSEVVQKTKLSQLIDGVSSLEFLRALKDKISDAEAETAVAVGESRFDGDGWTARQVLLLRSAICYRTAASCLDGAWLQFATGTQEPLLMDPDAIESARLQFHSEAERLEGLATSGIESTPKRPFSKPSAGASTFTVGSSDRRPSARNVLTDERDDVSASDTENG